MKNFNNALALQCLMDLVDRANGHGNYADNAKLSAYYYKQWLQYSHMTDRPNLKRASNALERCQEIYTGLELYFA